MIDTVVCGDCLDVMKDIPIGSVDLVLTDIPFNEVNRADSGLYHIDRGNADILVHDVKVLTGELIRITKGSGYVFCGWAQITPIIEVIRDHSLTHRLCCWSKPASNPMNGQFVWLSSAEYCVYFKKPSATFNYHCKGSVWTFPTGTGVTEHPTEKPVNLFKYLIEASSNAGDIVCDPFLGSGTTAVACIQTGRHYIGIEQSREYCDIAERRVKSAVEQIGMNL